MKIFFDNQIIRKIVNEQIEIEEDLLITDSNDQLILEWPSLLEYLNLGALLNTFPTFDQNHKLFDIYLSTLSLNSEKNLLFNLYDHLFAECLTHIQVLPQIDASFLTDCIRKKRKDNAPSLTYALFLQPLDLWEKLLIEDSYRTIHHLTFYLAWDRLCISIANLFDHQSSDFHFLQGLKVLKECLIESFQHITQHKQTTPSFFKLIEALFFYQMREENLQTYTDSEWMILNQNFPLFKSKDELMDFFYIDNRVVTHDKLHEEDPIRIFTLDSRGAVNSRLALANLMIEKLKKEVPGWNYGLGLTNFVYLKQNNKHLVCY